MSDVAGSAAFAESLREAHETYRHLVEGIPAVLYIDANDEASTNIFTSPQVEAMLGFPVERWRDANLWADRIHEADRERVGRAHRESLLNGKAFRVEYRLIAADGREVWVRDEAVLVSDAERRPLFWRGILSDISTTKGTEDKLRRSLEVLRATMEDRQRLLQRLEEAQEEERRRIAADIHDDTIQVMSAADIRAQSLAARLDDPELRAEADELREVIRASVERMRHLLFELRPPALDEEGLVAALRAYAADGDPMPQIVDRLRFEPPPEVRATVFRIAQEAIANARKHAKASAISISLVDERGGISLTVSDDGKGFDVATPGSRERGHIGLLTMVERAELAGGRCSVDSTPGAGTTVSVWLPVGTAAVAGA